MSFILLLSMSLIPQGLRDIFWKVLVFLHDLPQKAGAVNKPVSYSIITFYKLLLYPLSFYKKFTFPTYSVNPPFACP